ncbi:hypothetical protein ACOMHN_055009 [Nucella lapillus]
MAVTLLSGLYTFS